MHYEKGRRFSCEVYSNSVSEKNRRHSSGYMQGIEQSYRKEAAGETVRKSSSSSESNAKTSIGNKRRRTSVKNNKYIGTVKENEKQEAKQEIDPQEAFRGFAYEKIKQVFDITTVNGDIYINVDNVFPLMKTLELDPKDETVLDMVRTACIETFGDMDPVEFDQAVVEQRRQKAEEPEDFENEIRTAFNLIDVDQDGMISLQDVYQLMMGLGEMLTDEELMEMISSADYDNDGQISYKEFKRFLLDLSEEDMQDEEEEEAAAEEEQEKEEEEENAENDDTNEAKEGEAQNESEVKPESEATKENEEPNAEENKSEETKTDTEEAKPKLKEKKRSVLWGYTSQEKIKEEAEKKKAEEEKKKAEEEKKRLEEEKKAELAKEEKEKANSETNGEEKDDEQTSGITAVTIKHLDSIKEEGNSNENSPNTQQRKVYRPGSSRLARTRPNSSVTVSESVNEDSGIGMADSEHYNTDLEVTEDDGLTPRVDKTRTPSVGSRVSSARSRKPSARSRVSSARSRAETIQTESTSIDLELSDIENVDDDDKDDDDASSITDPNVFHSPPSARQQSQIEKLCETLTYCEIVNPNAEIRRHSGFGSRSNSPQLSYKPYEDYLQYDQKFTGLKRVKSSNTLRRIQDIEQTLLKRQKTAPQLDMDAIRQANMSLTTKVKPKHNVNGICTHLSIDLKIPLTDKTKITNYDKYMQRPKTAVPFIERQRKQLIRSSSFTTGRLVNEKNTDSNVNVIDLSKTLSSKNSGYYESPMMSLYHHGYKTVRPLARVMSAHLKSKSNSKEIEFNSISRQLEKGFIVRHERSRSETRSVTPSVKTKQTVINLEMEVQSTNKPKCKRFSSLSRIPREIPSWS